MKPREPKKQGQNNGEKEGEGTNGDKKPNWKKEKMQ
jgi:hypothetical protein